MAHVRKARRGGKTVWVVDYVDATGKRRRCQFPTREKAEDFLAGAIKESRQAAPACENPEITLGEFAPRWIEDERQHLQPRTIKGYEQLLRLYIEPAFGDRKLRAIHAGHVRALLTELRRKGLGKNTVRLVRATLSVLFSAAVEDAILATNPARAAGEGRRRRAEKMTQNERQRGMRPFAAAELTSLEKKLREENPGAKQKIRWLPYPPYRMCLLTLARAGLRPGEAYALEPRDLDFAARKIAVERAVSDGVVGDTKTGERRTVDMSIQLASELRDYLTWRKTETLRRGWAETPRFLFFNEEGNLLDESRVRKVMARACERAGVAHRTPYDLRHTFATLLLSGQAPGLGGHPAPLTYVSAQLGHSKPTTTLAWYAHWIPNDSGVRYVDALDGEVPERKDLPVGASVAPLWHHGTESMAATGTDDDESVESSRVWENGPPRDRTEDPLIKSQSILLLLGISRNSPKQLSTS